MEIITIHANGTSANLMKGIDQATIHLSLPGHDDIPLIDSYSLPNLREYVINTVVEKAGDDEVVIIGNSIGGLIAHQIADKINLKALITIGIPPLNYAVLEGTFLENEYTKIANTANITEEQMIRLSKAMASTPEGVEMILSAIKKSDPRVREELISSLGAGDLRDEYEILSGLDIPILFVKCSNDLFINNDKFNNLTFGEVVEIKGPHVLSPDSVDELNEVIRIFLKKNFN